MSPGGLAVGAKLVTLIVSSPFPAEWLGVTYPLLLRECVETALTPGTENVPRDPSGNESVWMSTEERAVVASPCRDL